MCSLADLDKARHHCGLPSVQPGDYEAGLSVYETRLEVDRLRASARWVYRDQMVLRALSLSRRLHVAPVDPDGNGPEEMDLDELVDFVRRLESHGVNLEA